MIFKENLIKLRKQRGLSQEELAEKIEVSRQTIYKWETGQNYPEMDRLVILSELFNCSIDDLIKTEINVTNVTHKDKYDKFYSKYARNIAFGVWFVLLGVSVMLLLFDILGEEKYIIPTIVLLGFVGVSVIIFIIYSIQNNEMKKQLPKEANFYYEEEIQVFSKRYSIAMAIGVGLVLLAVITIIVMYELFNEDALWPTAVMIFIISIATYIFVYFGLLNSKYRMEHKVKEENPLATKITSVIMIIATIVYFVIGFIYNKWHPGWIVFPIGGMLSGIVSIIFANQNT